MLNPNDLQMITELVGSTTPIQLMMDRFLSRMAEAGHPAETMEFARAGFLIGAVEAYNTILGATRVADGGQAMAQLTLNMKADFDRLLA